MILLVGFILIFGFNIYLYILFNLYRAEVEGNRRRGRPRRRWMDGVKGCLSERGLSIPEAEECVKDRREWRRIVGGRRR